MEKQEPTILIPRHSKPGKSLARGKSLKGIVIGLPSRMDLSVFGALLFRVKKRRKMVDE
jgi:hypothetical protein